MGQKIKGSTDSGLKTLGQFVSENESQEHAAAVIGVSFSTLNRWLNRKSKPRGLSKDRLKALNVAVD